MAESTEFKAWQKLEIARHLGQLERIQEALDEQMSDKNLKIEYF